MEALARALPRPRLPSLGSLPPWPTLRRRAMVALAALIVLAAGYHFWLRDSSLVAVERVEVRGAEQSPGIDSKLRAAGLEQTTLHVDLAALEAAVASDPAVRAVSAEADFPHGLLIDVDLRRPAGFLRSEGVVVAGDGVILERTGSAPPGVPLIKAKDGKAAGGDQLSGEPRAIAQVLGATPGPLTEAIEFAKVDPTAGIVVELSGGLELRFGSRSDSKLKWQAAAAVLADPKLETATYIDLSVPERPVAGGVPDARAEAAAIDPESAAAEVVAPAPETTVEPELVAPVEPVVPAVPATPTDPTAVP